MVLVLIVDESFQLHCKWVSKCMNHIKCALASCLISSLLMFSVACQSEEFSKNNGHYTVGSPIQDGLGDRSFADMTYVGLAKAKDKWGIKLIFDVGHQTAVTEDEREASIQRLIDKKVDLIVASGWQFLDVFKKMAQRYPHQKFFLNEVPVKGYPNISSTVFAQHEGSFLVGCLAGWMSKTNKIGFVGAMDLPVIHAFRVGYIEGAKYANPDIDVQYAFVTTGNDFSGFEKPEEGLRLAEEQYNDGVDIIYQVAGGQTGRGVIEAARKHQKYAIGVDIDEDHIAKGFVLTSMIKRIDVSTYKEVTRISKGTFKAGITKYGLADQGVSLSPMKFTKHLIPNEILKKLSDVKARIISGDIQVTDYLNTHK